MTTTSPHCCETMRSHVEQRCEQHRDPFDCPGSLVHYSPRSREYGLIIHDGGSSSITIAYCPWCGAALPGRSKRERQRV